MQIIPKNIIPGFLRRSKNFVPEDLVDVVGSMRLLMSKTYAACKAVLTILIFGAENNFWEDVDKVYLRISTQAQIELYNAYKKSQKEKEQNGIVGYETYNRKDNEIFEPLDITLRDKTRDEVIELLEEIENKYGLKAYDILKSLRFNNTNASKDILDLIDEKIKEIKGKRSFKLLIGRVAVVSAVILFGVFVISNRSAPVVKRKIPKLAPIIRKTVEARGKSSLLRIVKLITITLFRIANSRPVLYGGIGALGYVCYAKDLMQKENEEKIVGLKRNLNEKINSLQLIERKYSDLAEGYQRSRVGIAGIPLRGVCRIDADLQKRYTTLEKLAVALKRENDQMRRR